MDKKETSPQDIINFWYASDISIQWFNSTQSLDLRILNEYESIWKKARDGELEAWQFTAEGCLALAIILDQFPLNMFRGTAKSFSTEKNAIVVSKWAISRGFDKELPQDQVSFLYMPLMHSESIDCQNMAVASFEDAGLKNNTRFAKHHRGIIKRFARFPHRNKILGRESTVEEIEWLASDEAFKD